MPPDFSAIAKWPNVPACHGWLSLDRRGRWRLRGEPVIHRGLVDFINRQYGCTGAGEWFLQNGPQRVFVTLEYTPWIWRMEGKRLVAHTGADAGAAAAAFVDEKGNVLLQTTLGIGLLDDRDLQAFLGACAGEAGAPASEAELLGAMAGSTRVTWRYLPLRPIGSADVATTFGFCPDPQPA